MLAIYILQKILFVINHIGDQEIYQIFRSQLSYLKQFQHVLH